MRADPLQGRGKLTVRKILDTTADLLNTHPPDVLTTNLIAETAGIAIGTLYRYFPDKGRIYAHLAGEFSERILNLFRDLLSESSVPLDTLVDRVLTQGLALNEAVPGLKRLLVSDDLGPEAVQAAAQTNRQIHAILSGYLVKKSQGRLDPEQADLGALTTIHLFFSLFQARAAHPELKSALLGEYRTLVTQYWKSMTEPRPPMEPEGVRLPSPRV